jgi:hypothetical protein
LSAVITEALDDPRLVNAFTNAIVSAHRALLENGSGDVVLDTGDVTRAVRDALAKYDANLAALLTPQQPLQVELGNENLPTLGNARDTVRAVMLLGAIAGIALICASLVLDHSRKAVGRAGRRTVYLGLWPLLLFGALPLVLDGQQGGLAEVGNAFLRSYGSRVLPASIALTVIGGAVALGALALRRSAAPAALPHVAAPMPAPPPPPTEPPTTKETIYI